MLLAVSYFASSCTFRLDRIAILGPVGHINVVHVLLYNMVSAKPVEVVPVAHLVFHLRLSRGALLYPYTPIVPVHLSSDNVSQGSILDAFHDFPIVVLVVTLQAHDHVQFLRLGYLSSGQHLADTCCIGGYGFFHKNLLALAHCLLKVRRAETWRGSQNHNIGFSNGFFVGIETHEATLLRYIDLVFAVLFNNGLVAAFQSVFKGIGHGNQLDGMAGIKGLKYSPCTSTSTANHGELEVVLRCGIGTWDQKGGSKEPARQ